MINLFFEPSTRTSISFASAMQRLGGTVVNYSEDFSSQKKGESLEDTIRILAGYANCLVIRHPGIGFVQAAAHAVPHKPIINAGAF